MMFKDKGKLHYDKDDKGGYKLILVIDQGIVEFYRSLIPKHHEVKRGRYGAHISVVRKETIKPLNQWKWGLHEGLWVPFHYDIDTKTDSLYWWLDVYSSELEEIRLELGLGLTNFQPCVLGEGFRKRFHLTLGNVKAFPPSNDPTFF